MKSGWKNYKKQIVSLKTKLKKLWRVHLVQVSPIHSFPSRRFCVSPSPSPCHRLLFLTSVTWQVIPFPLMPSTFVSFQCLNSSLAQYKKMYRLPRSFPISPNVGWVGLRPHFLGSYPFSLWPELSVRSHVVFIGQQTRSRYQDSDCRDHGKNIEERPCAFPCFHPHVTSPRQSIRALAIELIKPIGKLFSPSSPSSKSNANLRHCRGSPSQDLS